ncbi:hypothetical protein QBC41DRAFT_319355 [Cercophora samala]|uniref:Vacuolar ATPase assembly protein VMA22 n=1 Tax=Cercophora samala TaxID=330535 RepID=A0AA39ZEP8_9PEZI|nr:hypothetical protein QBC41DRAFT_319355 [Cercophora samala]
MSTSKIDSLLQQYLVLLNEYTTLRTTLNAHQASLYQHLARANFAAQPGVRYYGQDYYDERMQATSRLDITISPDTNTPEFKLTKPPATTDEPSKPPEKENKTFDEPQPSVEDENNNTSAARDEATEKDKTNNNKNDDDENDNDEKPKSQQPKKKSNDPLRWFGILTPLPLRLAQASAKTAVEDAIPQLATLSEQMKALELEVRRERKKRAKAEKEEARLKMKDLEEKIAVVEV